MKALLLLFVFLASPQAAPADPCSCRGCEGAHLMAIGRCRDCKADIPSMTDRLCSLCASEKGKCLHCGKAMANPRAFVGTPTTVDKQPRADLIYFVCVTDDGRRQGIYRDPKAERGYRDGVRAMLFTSEGPQGEKILKQFIQLDAKEKDFEAQGTSDKPVRWRIGAVVGPEQAPQDGKYRLLLPAAPSTTVEVICGDRVLSRARYENGTWKTVP